MTPDSPPAPSLAPGPGARTSVAAFSVYTLCNLSPLAPPANAARACPLPAFGYPLPMNFDDLLDRYFGTTDLAAASPAVREAGVDKMRVDFGLESDRARKFALWAVLYMLGQAPDLDVAFKAEEDREAARNLMDLLHGQGEG